jgi:DNA-directed RNA polymerase subunit RPC12/RpoP
MSINGEYFMSIEFYCSGCQSKLRTPDGSAGKGARCPNCGNIELVPEASAPSAPPDPIPPVAEGFPVHGDHESAKPNSGNPFSSLPQPGSDNPFAGRQASMNPYAVRPASSYVPRVDAHTAKNKLLAPAILLAIFNALALVFCLFGVLGFSMEVVENRLESDDVFGILVIGIGLMTSVLGLFGAICMLRMKGYGMAVAGSIGSILSGLACCLLPMGFGIWALVILMDTDVKRFFR